MAQYLHSTANEYGAVVSVVYATYVVFEPVWANLLKILSPRYLRKSLSTTLSCFGLLTYRIVSGTTFCWGVLTLSTAWAGSYEHLIAIRVLLGVFEGELHLCGPGADVAAGLFPCITVYIMMNYRREETGRRMSYIFSCAAFAGAVGGLIAGGLVTIESGALVGWQWLYIVSQLGQANM